MNNSNNNKNNNNKKYGVERDPFSGSSALQRTPPEVKKTVVRRNSLADPSELRLAVTTKADAAAMALHPPDDVIGKGKLAVLEWHVEALIAFIGPRHNVHSDVKRKVARIRDICLQIQEQATVTVVKPSQPERADKEVQVGNKLVDKQVQVGATPVPMKSFAAAAALPKRPREKGEASPTSRAEPKRRKGDAENVPTATAVGGSKPKTEKPKAGKPKAGKTNAGKPVVASAEWTTVRTRSRTKSPKSKPVRPDAIVIRESGLSSYADILRTIKKDPQLSELGESVRRIRKTAKGELLLELRAPADPKTPQYRDAVRSVLGTSVEVRKLTQETLVEVKDLDEVTTVEDVHEALCKQLNASERPPVDAIRSLRKAYGGTQTATISLPHQTAMALVEAGRLRVGWTSCRVREKLAPLRCYKCMAFGHTALKCNSKEDWRNKCYRCGGEGHNARECEKPPVCALCEVKGRKDVEHPTGCSKCPSYKQAAEQYRRRR